MVRLKGLKGKKSDESLDVNRKNKPVLDEHSRLLGDMIKGPESLASEFVSAATKKISLETDFFFVSTCYEMADVIQTDE